jgi:hypothetical protein
MSSESAPKLTRRAILAAAVVASLALETFPGFAAEEKLATPPKLRTYTAKALGITLTFPAGWFLSDKGSDGLVTGDLSTVVLCSVSRGPAPAIAAMSGDDPRAVAFALLAPRAKGGASVYVTEAEGAGGKWVFGFDAETAMPNGDVIVRKGVGRAFKDGPDVVVVEVTAPREGWADERKKMCEGVVASAIVGHLQN